MWSRTGQEEDPQSDYQTYLEPGVSGATGHARDHKRETSGWMNGPPCEFLPSSVLLLGPVGLKFSHQPQPQRSFPWMILGAPPACKDINSAFASAAKRLSFNSFETRRGLSTQKSGGWEGSWVHHWPLKTTERTHVPASPLIFDLPIRHEPDARMRGLTRCQSILSVVRGADVRATRGDCPGQIAQHSTQSDVQ